MKQYIDDNFMEPYDYGYLAAFNGEPGNAPDQLSDKEREEWERGYQAYYDNYGSDDLSDEDMPE